MEKLISMKYWGFFFMYTKFYKKLAENSFFICNDLFCKEENMNRGNSMNASCNMVPVIFVL